MIDFLQELSNFIFTSKYARYDEEKKRRETWPEAVDRVCNMHLNRFAFLPVDDKATIRKVFEMVKEDLVVPSMRSMQFGGKAIEAKNERLFNCSCRHMDSLRSFAEVFFLLLCGCGVTIGLNKKFLGRLPNLVSTADRTDTTITYIIEDTIEGWADSVEALMNCYFKNTPYTGRRIVFDYSKIRKKGSTLKTGGGKAPGANGLKHAHQQIKKVLDHAIEYHQQSRLRSIDAYDIVMHCADAVLSGGVRRAATAAIFHPDDIDMLNAKADLPVTKYEKFAKTEKTTGGYIWYDGFVWVDGVRYEVEIKEFEYQKLISESKIFWKHIHPQRGRSNNSVLLIRNKISIEEFRAAFERTKLYGEPGFVFGNDEDQLLNPCQPAFAPVVKYNDGKAELKQFADVKIGDMIWSESGWTTVTKKWSTGIKPVYAYKTHAGIFYGTAQHRIVQDGQKIEVQDADGIDVLRGPYSDWDNFDIVTIMDGLVIGDGSKHLESANKVFLNIGADDQDYFDSELSELIGAQHSASVYGYNVTTTIQADELPHTYDRVVPERFVYADHGTIRAFLRGLYSANGSVVANRITLKSASFRLIEQVQLMLSAVGIRSYYTTNKEALIEWENGSYVSKKSYDLNISVDRDVFRRSIGFIQKYKMSRLDAIHVKSSQGKKTYDITDIEFLGNMEVFDITVENESHTYWTGGLNVSNCFEVNFIPVTIDGVAGVQFCNLSSVNGAKVKTFEEMLDAVWAATVIGTLQAAYTNFPYLSNTAQQLTEEEALLGVSITGIMDSPEILLNPRNQFLAAQYVIQTNKEWAAKLGINQAARTTLVKPEGTSSLKLKSASGIHPHHAHRYFRRVQANKVDPIYKFFKKHNPHMCEESVWSQTKSDDVITFPVEVPTSAMVKADLTAIRHLDIIKNTQQNWVDTGTTEANRKPIRHNVSCTVEVDPNEWEEVILYLYENRQFFSAVSLLPKSGDRDYEQAPLQRITDADEEQYRMIVEKYKPVDYTKLIEDEDRTSIMETIACAGGACEVVFPSES